MLDLATLQVDQKVTVPGHKKRKAAPGVITWVGQSKGLDSQGNEFVWVTVRDLAGKEQNWPSSRLDPRGDHAS